MKVIIYTVPAFVILLSTACNRQLNSMGGDGSVNPLCSADPNASTLCWLDGAIVGDGNGGFTQNPSCSVDSPTTLTGTVHIPAGTLPLPNARVYIAQTPAPDDPLAPPNLPPIKHGVTCETCDQIVPADAISNTTTDLNGQFKLSNIPVPPDGKAEYLIVRVGKWRRSLRIENQNSRNANALKISRCSATSIDPNLTRLPKNQSEGDIPKIALSTGKADSMECLFRSPKIGLDDSEFTVESKSGSINLYATNAVNQFSNGDLMTKTQVRPALSWWDNLDNLNKYDIIILSCEGTPDDTSNKSGTAFDNLQSYINAGGRVFASHYHNVWISYASGKMKDVATFPSDGATSPINTDIITLLPNGMPFQKGINMKQWLKNAGALTSNDQLYIEGARQTIGTVNSMYTQTWVTYQPAPPASNVAQYFSFYAPVGAPSASQCGQMVFTDLHVSSSDISSFKIAFPNGCTTTSLSSQEKALIFMLFDLSNCITPGAG